MQYNGERYLDFARESGMTEKAGELGRQALSEVRKGLELGSEGSADSGSAGVSDDAAQEAPSSM